MLFLLPIWIKYSQIGLPKQVVPGIAIYHKRELPIPVSLKFLYLNFIGN